MVIVVLVDVVEIVRGVAKVMEDVLDDRAQKDGAEEWETDDAFDTPEDEGDQSPESRHPGWRCSSSGGCCRSNQSRWNVGRQGMEREW